MSSKKILGKIITFRKKLLSRIRKNPTRFFLILLIIILSVFFRTYKYTDRVFIQADNSRDVQVAKYAADNLKIPQIGQFSSAGPFFYGPWYYWFLEIVSFLPLGFLTLWYVMSSIYLIFIILIYWLGKEVGGIWVGLLASLFASISPAQINYSFSVWNPAIVPFLVLLTMIFLVRFYKYKKLLDIFILGFLVGLAITIHFQNILILPTLFVVIFLIKPSLKNYLKYFSALTLGFFIPFIPLMYFDLRFHWHNFISIFVFLTIDQFSIWIPNRWLTYLRDYWPETWGYIIGGNKIISALTIVFLSIFFIKRLATFKKNKIFYLIAVTFLIEVILYRYYRGERYQYYSLFTHPAVVLLTAWVSVQIFKFKKTLGLLWIIILFIMTFNVARIDLKERGITLAEINSLKKEIYSKYPASNFDIYGCHSNASSISHPLALIMYSEGRNSIDGIKVGVCETGNLLSWNHLTYGEVNNPKILWINKSTEVVYRVTTEWWIENPPKSGGEGFWEFVRKKFSPRCYPHC